MRKIIILSALITIAVAGCQQKEQPVPQQQFPSGPVQAGPLQMQGDVKILQDAVKSDPRNVEAWIRLGNISMDSSRFKEAIEAYQKALDLDPKNVDVRVDLGTCYKNIGRPDRAAEEYRKALKINPNHINGHKNLGVVLAFDLNDRAGGIREFEKYLELFPAAPDAVQLRQEIQRMKAAR